MLEAVLVGAGVALGLIGLFRSVWPIRPSLGSLVGNRGRGDTEGRGIGLRAMADPSMKAASGGVRGEVGSRAARVLVAHGWDRWVPAADLAIAEQTMPRLCAKAFEDMFIFGCLPVALWALSIAAGSPVAPGAVGWAVLLCALGGLFVPLLEMKSRARKRRDHFRRAVAAFLGMVVLAQAGGMGIDGALSASASISADWAFARMKRALDAARHLRVTPWDALGALGAEVGVMELAEVSMHIALAGSEGARVRESLAAKSASLRRQEMARLETRANAVTEKMFLPGVILMVGFLVFIGYPAFESVLRVT